ncbi:MAG: transglycosylase SLT domain-containing protein [Bacteroidota bacterium]
MSTYHPAYRMQGASGVSLIPYGSYRPRLPIHRVFWVACLLLLSNLVTYQMFGLETKEAAPIVEEQKGLYLLDQTDERIINRPQFETKVAAVSEALQIAPEWLMAVMYTESRFNPAIRNRKGSGAVGLIQFMVPAVKDINRRLGTKYYMHDIEQMDAMQQLDLVQVYLQTVKERYGELSGLTDLYLAVLFPKAIGQAKSYTLFSRPGRAYRQNAGLDENADGSVTVLDIDTRMKRLYPTAYHATR